MKNYEKSAFSKIFLGYFISVSMFILLLGFLYFQQHKNIILQKTAMNMHQYLLKLKETNFKYKENGYSYIISNINKVKKQLPQKKNNVYQKAFTNKFVIHIKAKIVDQKIYNLKFFTISLQVLLIIIFSFISYILAKRSLKPMIDTISHLDRFIGDLIHDLHTPVASILLNTSMLKKNSSEYGLNKIKRIEDSANNILYLYENLEVLLGKKVFKKSKINFKKISDEIILIYKNLYPKISFTTKLENVSIKTNEYALIRILDNIISNGCKYSIDKDPNIKIICKNNKLIIEDNGKGMIYPKKVFERNYTENQNGYGIGMHIVYRLCGELDHNINIESEEKKGTKITIVF